MRLYSVDKDYLTIIKPDGTVIRVYDPDPAEDYEEE